MPASEEFPFCCFHFYQLIQRILGHFLEQALKRKLWDDGLGQLLLPADLSEGNSTRSVMVRPLDPRPSGTSSSLGGFHLLALRNPLTLESSRGSVWQGPHLVTLALCRI